jgi:phospholipase C
MTKIDRRTFLSLAAASTALPPSIAHALQIDARVRTGTIRDVEHVVILMQENRSFDHYFGTMAGVRGFGDRFPVPLAGGRTAWSQANPGKTPTMVAPFPLNTQQTFAHMRVEGTPHSWADAQYAWDEGRMGKWPEHKGAHAMGHYVEADIPFQFALANAFTLCEAYHCSFQGGTNTNRLFLWTGTNDPAGRAGGPSISNSHDQLATLGGAADSYTWTTYPERLEAAGISWRVYEDMADNFTDNPLAGFKAFRDSFARLPGSNPALAEKGLSTRHLDGLRDDVVAGRLPQVSWIVAPSKDSEHPGPSSPAQGADYTARVLACLTSNPEVWAKTVFLAMFDENDGFFDHVPPPAPPSKDASGRVLGASNVDCEDEYHRATTASEATAERPDLMGRPYGLGPRVPMYVISPWSRGGWVNAQVFDHTSVIRFLEKRFGVMEPNISAWRRAVCGDLTTCFDFATPNAARAATLPGTSEVAARAAALPGRTTPPTPASVVAPVQAAGVRPSRALPYRLNVASSVSAAGELKLTFEWLGVTPVFASSESREAASPPAVVFHAYDMLRLDQPPRRYTVSTGANGRPVTDTWPAGSHDVCIQGPNGFFRRFTGSGGAAPSLESSVELASSKMMLRFRAPRDGRDGLTVTPITYGDRVKPVAIRRTGPRTPDLVTFGFDASAASGWHDLLVTHRADPAWRIRIAGRIESSAASTSDPAMGGDAVMNWERG